MASPFPENDVEVLRRYLPDDLHGALQGARGELGATYQITNVVNADFFEFRGGPLDGTLREQQDRAHAVNEARGKLLALFTQLELGKPDGKPPYIVKFDEITRKTKPKVKVIGGALVDEKVRDGSGNEAGHVKIGEGNIKINPAEAGVEGNLSVLDVEAAPKITENVSIIGGVKVAKAMVAVSKKGVEAEATAFEAGVGVKAGPVKAKVLFGLGAKMKMKDGKLGLN